MRLRIADFGLWIGHAIVPLIPLAVMPSAVVFAQSRPANTQVAASSAPATQPAAPQAPIAFARSGKGRVIRLPMIFSRPARQAVLRAFGRVWTEPALIGGDESGNLRLTTTVPPIRVPTVFSITPSDAPDFVLGELVAYPDHDVEWDKKITIYSCGAPAWFEQWASATGLPAKQVALGDLASAKLTPTDEKGKSLLILGREAAEKSYREFLEKRWRPAANILILDASWMSAQHTALKLKPAHMRGPLATISAQKWAKPLSFFDFYAPNRILCNRWSLTDSSPIPPLEVVGDLQTGPWVTLSGIPWQEQLGRCEQADELLLEVLKAASAFAPRVETLRQATLIYPGKVTYDPKTMAYCPALACVAQEEKATGSPRVLIVDLRGPYPAPADLLDRLAAQVKKLGNRDRLLLIGDDLILDQWEWLKLDREKKATSRPDVVWLEDDQPWEKTYEIPLLLKLTELGVPLAPPRQQEKEK